MKTDYMRAGGGQSVCTAPNNNNHDDACACEANRANINANHAYIDKLS